jgi:hypothetical protein
VGRQVAFHFSVDGVMGSLTSVVLVLFLSFGHGSLLGFRLGLVGVLGDSARVGFGGCQ